MNPFFATLSRWIERFLWLAAFVGIGVAVYGYGEGWIWQTYLNYQFDKSFESTVEAPSALDLAVVVETPESPYIGRLEVSRLDLSTMVLEGVDRSTLLRGIGHIPGTALPGKHGNIGVAGHRDTFFRRLSKVRIDDRIVLRTMSGTYKYTVDSIRVVRPQDRQVLASTMDDVLTLVTCYPFYFVGPAPQRFIVRAVLTH